MKISAERAVALIYTEGDAELEFECQRQTGFDRWMSHHELIAKDSEGRYWRLQYERGLTEYQEHRLFEGADEVELEEVEKYPVTAYEYRAVEKKEPGRI